MGNSDIFKEPNMNYFIFLGLFSSLALSENQSYDCPSGKSSSSFDITASSGVAFKTQEGDEYGKKAQCKIKFNLDSSCEEMELNCNGFDMAKGSQMTVKVGKNKAKKFKKSFTTVTATEDVLLTFKSKTKVASGASCSMSCTVSATGGGSGSETPSGGGSDGGSVPSNAEFCQVDSDHTMCKYEGPSDTCSAQTIYRELSADAKQAILDKHNELRRKVAKGEETDGAPGPQPAASNMRKLVWNNELEAVAQRWADQCQFGHDSSRNKLDGTAVGQNAYWGGSSVESEEAAVQAGMINAAQAWYDEVSDPGFDSGSISPYVFSSGTGHYTQVVWADTEELGCGMVYYKGSSWYETLIVCNYAISGNWMGGEMYKSGDACSSCPDGYTCDDGLCAAP